MKLRRRAISPIIGTLLMIGTGVTGGTTIMVIAPSYFDQTLLEQDPYDQLEIFGYSARDLSETVDSHFNSALTCTGASDSGGLTNGDCITIYVLNKGDKPSLVQNVIVFDKVYGFSSTGASSSTCQTVSDSFSVHTIDEVDQGIQPNEEATICIKYSGENKKIGSNIPVQIETQSGQDFELKIINGDMRK